ncbi:putative Bardet-Biedl syndrome 2 protein like protein [Monoraphidium neglectum]|uniref:Putative Bardet-Biedl syndrome 2 protein like protein n=1 Tax=Monoraphidium neglectum TaxID=145388 RepID=A0A0D2MAQ3_9CHLO|nr:putative Bardet-Biedl syndrome 2 protein like protein [Monoraphidium neglectum]KIZ00360.1 putative Bardet-Biedl syndrome 2 protein like protein [Monoraphidium neglectum]|eukprot:XP_013899379.1 putative Bardet-Biedl syndrome 2 protein like protein [Monoraphidium neglectum]
MLIPAFQLHLQERVQRGLATIGRFDAQHASLAGATHAGKVFVHSPHDPSGQRLALLNINKQITALVAGAILPSSTRDVLLIGSPNTLQCYDIERNRDLFFKDISEGVSCVVAGSYGSYTRPLAIVGGNCSVQGFDSDGNDVFWSVTGDVVSALALADIDGDGRNELLVGCDDFEIRIFKDEDLILQITEADQITGLAHLGGPRFAYALRNGTIGVYDGTTRLWRVKSKHSVAGILAFDLDGDGQPELVSGWSNGRVEARHAVTGEVVHRDSLGAAVAALLRGDLRGLGSEELVAVGTQGEVRGYATQSDELHVDAGDISMQQRALVDLAQKKQRVGRSLRKDQKSSGGGGGSRSSGGGGSSSGSSSSSSTGGSSLSLLQSRLTASEAPSICRAAAGTAAILRRGPHAPLHELMHELAGYLSAGPDPGGGGGAGGGAAAAAAAALPPDTRVDSAITINKASLVCELTLSTTNDSVIKAAMIFGEQVFEGESLLSVPAEPERTLTVPLAPARDAPVVLMIKALVGTKGSSWFHVFEIEMEMPKYAMYAAVEGSGNSSGSYGATGTGVSVGAGPGAALHSGGGGSAAAAAAAAAAAKLGSRQLGSAKGGCWQTAGDQRRPREQRPH